MSLQLQALRYFLQEPPKSLWLKRPSLRTRSVLEKGVVVSGSNNGEKVPQIFLGLVHMCVDG